MSDGGGEGRTGAGGRGAPRPGDYGRDLAQQLTRLAEQYAALGRQALGAWPAAGGLTGARGAGTGAGSGAGAAGGSAAGTGSGSAPGTGTGAGGIPGAGTDWLSLFRAMNSQAAVPVRQLEATVIELRARREQVRALRAQLAAFEEQLELLEQTLTPLLEWTQQWLRVQESFLGPGPGSRGQER